MKAANRYYKIFLVCETFGLVPDEYSYLSETGTFKTNQLLESMGYGFTSCTSVTYYANKGKPIPVDKPIRRFGKLYSPEYLKGLVYWSNRMERAKGEFFDTSENRGLAIRRAASCYKNVSIVIH